MRGKSMKVLNLNKYFFFLHNQKKTLFTEHRYFVLHLECLTRSYNKIIKQKQLHNII